MDGPVDSRDVRSYLLSGRSRRPPSDRSLDKLGNGRNLVSAILIRDDVYRHSAAGKQVGRVVLLEKALRQSSETSRNCRCWF